ncbi:MAG TPA: NAD(P)-dependent oxidoreductase [Herpetosiphonaceae bacterium]|nr:NAD(P)-dependent oxidoreductase [Herpetosiphonaceae bacterium]
MQKVAVLGLGIIGSGIARNILKAGLPLVVYNRSPERAQALAAEGAQVAGSPAEAAAEADVVIAAVPDDDVSRSVWLGPDGALESARAPAMLAECSTLSVAWVEQLGRMARERRLRFVDTPVLGSKDAAAAGQLRLLVGGEQETLDSVRPALETFSSEIYHLGPVGAGTRMKLINNSMALVQSVALAEGLVVAERSGLPLEQVVEILTTGSPGSPMVRSRAGRMANAEYEDVHFALRWMLKDARYGVEEGNHHGVRMATVAAARDVLQAAADGGLGDLDFAAVVEALRREGGA